MLRAASLAIALAASARAQQIGTLTPEVHPGLTSQTCTASGCTTLNTKIVLDANWRWLHDSKGTNCYTGNTWNAALCPDAATCAANCGVDGADYSGTYGISTATNAVTLKFVTTAGSGGKNIGSRVYLMQDDNTYEIFKLLNKEFTFDVDMSNLPCGLNGALYFSEMAADGGLSKYPTDKAGAKYGTGYCDAQCPQDLKFINGQANLDWTPSSGDPNSGAGSFGTCCSEMDIWEANSNAAAFTPHPCTVVGQTECSGTDCGVGDNRYKGVCDKDGCDFNSYRQGDQTFLGLGKTIDTKSKFTVVTQFITNTGTDTGTLVEIRRFYVQNGKTYANSVNKIAGIPAVNSITDAYCTAQKSVFADTPDFQAKGGLAKMGAAFSRGMVLVMSLWDDHAANALWLDSTYPTDSTHLGAQRGPCAITSGVPADVEAASPGASVTFSNIKVGTLNSTFAAGTVSPPAGGGGVSSSSSSKPATSSTTLKTSSTAKPVTTSTIKTSSTSTKPVTSSSAPAGPTVPKYGQCGGTGWTGGVVCAAGSTCTKSNDYYSQCL